MLAIALLVLSGDPIDDPAPSSSSAVAVRLHIARINGAVPLEKQTIATLDDIVLLADSNATRSARYQWQLVEKPASSTVALTNDDGREQRFRFFIKDRTVPGVDVAGVYRVRVDVISDAGSASDQIEVRVGASHAASTSSVAPDPPKRDTLGAQLTVAGWSAGCCLAMTAASAIGFFTFGAGTAPTCAFFACPCALAASGGGACFGTGLAAGSPNANAAVLPWLPVGAGIAAVGLILAVAGGWFGYTYLHGETDSPVAWYLTAAPILPGLLVLSSAPIVTFALAWLTAPDEILARGPPGCD